MYRLVFTIAFRYLRPRKREGFISAASMFSFVGIAISVAALIIVMSVMNGFRHEISKKFVGFDGDIKVILHDITADENITNSSFSDLSGVHDAYKIFESRGLIMCENNAYGSIIRGITTADFFKKYKNYYIQGYILNSEDHVWQDNEVVLGTQLARNLAVNIGDEVKLVTPIITSTMAGDIPRFKTYKVIGMVSIGMYDFDNSVAYITPNSARLLFKSDMGANIIQVYTDNYSEADRTAEKIRAKLQNDNVSVVTWLETNESMLTALKIEKIAMCTILFFIILIAAFNIISILTMIVKDKTQDIGILSTIGASKGFLVSIFLFAGFILGAVGTAIGLLLGVGISLNLDRIRIFLEGFTNTRIFDPVVYYLSNLPVQIETADVVMTVIVTMMLAIFASIYPAYKVSLIDPIKAVREGR